MSDLDESCVDEGFADKAGDGPVQQTAARILGVLRAGQAIVFVPAAVAMAVAPVSVIWLGGALAAVTLWAGVFSATALRRGLRNWLVIGDLLVTCAICLSIGRLLPIERIPQGTGWVQSSASLCIIGLPLAWRARWSIPAGMVVVVAFIVGYRLAGHPELGRLHTLTLIGQLLCSAIIMSLVRRTSDAAEASLVATNRESHFAKLSEARRLDERVQLRMLHDTALTTLTLVGTGVRVGRATLARQAKADLAAIERIACGAIVEERPIGLAAVLRAEIANYTRRLSVDSTLAMARVPAQVGLAFAGAVREALENIVRHAGTRRAVIVSSLRGGQVRVEVRDNGIGFAPATVRPGRYGIRESIMARMAAVSGHATLGSAPGTGTTWILEWPASVHSAASPPEPSADVAQTTARRYGDGTLRGAILIAFGWHTFNDLAGVVSGWGTYYNPPVGALGWLVYTIVGSLAAARLLRGRSIGSLQAQVGLLLLLGACVAQSVTTPAQLTFTTAHWAWINFCWFAMLLLWRFPMKWLLAAVGLDILLTLVALLLTREMDRVAVAEFATVAYGASAIEISIAWGARVLQRRANAAARAVSERAAAQAAEIAAEEVHRDRQHRYDEIGQAGRQLLADLADGTLDPAAPDVQRRSMLEASRLRRLIAEHDDVPSPLTHELRACADIAERRGVEVSIESAGTPPPLPLPVRRALTDAPMLMLSRARTRARITVCSYNDEVEVSLVADADPPQLPRITVAGVSVNLSQEGGALWLRTRWHNQ